MAEFEWDARKAEANRRKHGVTFEDAKDAFRDRFAVEWIDRRQDYGEERSILIGVVRGRIMTIAFVERGERIRIISARQATRYEQSLYFSGRED